MLCLAPSDLRLDAQLANPIPVAIMVIGAICKQRVGALSGATDGATHRWHGLDQGKQLGDIVAVAAREPPRKRRTVGVGEDVVLGARSSAVYWAWTGLRAPFLAWM